MRFPTQSQFQRWVAMKSPGAVVGKACSFGDCPLATYLREHGAADPYVRPDKIASESYWRPHHNVRRPLPEWANKFAIKLDYYCEPGSLVLREYVDIVLASLGKTLEVTKPDGTIMMLYE